MKGRKRAATLEMKVVKKRKLQTNNNDNDDDGNLLSSSSASSSSPSKPPRYTFASPLRQHFSLPETIIYYLAKNKTNSKAFQKLIQSCKYFFRINSTIVTEMPEFKNGNLWIEEAATTSNGSETFEISIEKIPHKIWLTNGLRCDKGKYCISRMLQKLFYCEISLLNLRNQILTFEEYLLLTKTGKVEHLCLRNVVVRNFDKSIVPLNELMGPLRNIVNLKYTVSSRATSVITIQTSQKLLELPQFKGLKTFYMRDVPESIDIHTFGKFVINHITAKFELIFANPISEKAEETIEEFLLNFHNTNKKCFFQIIL